MVLIIDACNIKAGGGQLHLTELLRVAPIKDCGFTNVIVCAPSKTLAKIPNVPYVRKHFHLLLDRTYLHQWIWRKFILKKLLASNNALLFIPGTIKPPFNWPYVTMCQNLLPLQYSELLRYGLSFATIRLLTLRLLHLRTYELARGNIFLTKYCYDVVSSMRKINGRFTIIPHGINHALFDSVPAQVGLTSREDSFKLLYVSVLDVYKHQDKVSRAVINLNKRGYNVNLTLVGPAYGPSKAKIQEIINSPENTKSIISYLGVIPHDQLKSIYESHDGFVFASTCETFGMIVTEAMATGIPILCTNRSSLKETVGNAALYFDPLDIGSIEQAILLLKENDCLRRQLSANALRRSKIYTWETCAQKTFSFLADTARSCGF